MEQEEEEEIEFFLVFLVVPIVIKIFPLSVPNLSILGVKMNLDI